MNSFSHFYSNIFKIVDPLYFYWILQNEWTNEYFEYNTILLLSFYDNNDHYHKLNYFKNKYVFVDYHAVKYAWAWYGVFFCYDHNSFDCGSQKHLCKCEYIQFEYKYI